MNLTPADVVHFFQLMWALQFHVKRQLNLLPGVDTVEQYAKLGLHDKMAVREALWAHLDLLDDFVAANPAGLAPDDLRIVGNWKRCVVGRFYVFRLLKRHTIFISGSAQTRVYAVTGLQDTFEDILLGRPLPIVVDTVLLPFKGRIIYDGLLSPYSIFFGAGVRSDLNEIYQRARQSGQIIESLEPDSAPAGPPKARKPGRNWGPVLDSLVETTEQLRQAETVVQGKAFGVLKASARLAQAAAHNPDDLDELFRLSRRAQNALRQFETALDRTG